MSNKELKKINDLAKEAIVRVNKMSKAEAQQTLINAGILTKKGNYTAAYKTLGRVSKAS